MDSNIFDCEEQKGKIVVANNVYSKFINEF